MESREVKPKYYCGRFLGKSELLGSDGYCGPNNGPQCRTCKAHQPHKVQNILSNSDGYYITRGERSAFYCGRYIGTDKLPGSDGYCGPTNGPQCRPCLKLQQHKPATVKNFKNSDGIKVCVGTTKQFYCGRYIGTANLPGSDGYCGPTNGPQCRSCTRLQQHQPQKSKLQNIKNSNGHKVCLGELNRFYCGKYFGTASLPGSDGYCGPTNGPQCSSCASCQIQQLENLRQIQQQQLKQALQHQEQHKEPQPEENESKTCKICFEKEVNCVFIPCGHVACCHDCAVTMKACPFCRIQITSIVKMFVV